MFQTEVQVHEWLERFQEHQRKVFDHIEAVEREGVKIFRVSTTERQEFKECRRKWDLSSNSRQNLEPKVPAVALWFGKLIHKGLEEYYQNNADPREIFEKEASAQLQAIKEEQHGLFPEQIAKLEETYDLGCGMLDGYVQWARRVDASKSLGFKYVLMTESEFIVPIPNPITGEEFGRFVDANGQIWELYLVGRFDLIVMDWLNHLWIVDHKTSQDVPKIERLETDDQMSVYLWGVQRLFQTKFEGVYYNVLRKKLPRRPPLLKTGGLSRAKEIDTTYDVYLNTIHQYGFKESDYAAILEHLKNKPNTFYVRIPLRRTQEYLYQVGYWLWFEALDMLNDPALYPNQTWDCNWRCDFQSVCKAMFRGDDFDFLLRNMYRTREVEGVYDRQKIKPSKFTCSLQRYFENQVQPELYRETDQQSD